MSNSYDTIYIFVPEAHQLIRISEGTGDNLSGEDIENGYVDYIYYEQHEVSIGLPETDGGMILLTEPFQKKFKNTKEAIPSVLDMAYSDESKAYIVLE